MTDELLFGQIPESKSPYEAFKDRHGIKITYYSGPGRHFASVEFSEVEGSGLTEREAVFTLAQKLQLAGFQSVNFDEPTR